MCKSVL